MFSVVIPLYNKSYSIVKCLNSVLAQTYSEFEVVIVNDGSTDDSLRLLDQYLDPRVTIYSQSNCGVSVARNKGVELSKSEYVCFLDADDFWDINFLEAMKALIHDFPGGVLYCLGHNDVDKYGNKKYASNILGDYRGFLEDFYKISSRSSVANSSKVCVSKKAFDLVGGFPEGVVAGEDLFLWIRLVSVGSVVLDATPYANVLRVDDDSRVSRQGAIPYPLIYYSKQKIRYSENKDLVRYLVRIGVRHILGSLSAGRYREAANRNLYLQSISFLSATVMWLAFLIPPVAYRFIKKYKNM